MATSRNKWYKEEEMKYFNVHISRITQRAKEKKEKAKIAKFQ